MPASLLSERDRLDSRQPGSSYIRAAPVSEDSRAGEPPIVEDGEP